MTPETPLESQLQAGVVAARARPAFYSVVIRGISGHVWHFRNLNTAFPKLGIEILLDPLRLFGAPGCAADLVPLLEKGLGDVGADEARDAGDKDTGPRRNCGACRRHGRVGCKARSARRRIRIAAAAAAVDQKDLVSLVLEIMKE